MDAVYLIAIAALGASAFGLCELCAWLLGARP